MGLELGEEFDFEFQVLLKYFLKSFSLNHHSNFLDMVKNDHQKWLKKHLE